jgi:hypothetical protein
MTALAVISVGEALLGTDDGNSRHQPRRLPITTANAVVSHCLTHRAWGHFLYSVDLLMKLIPRHAADFPRLRAKPW